MERKNRAVFVILTAVIIIAAIFSAFGLTFFEQTPTLNIPQATAADGSSGTDASSDSTLAQVAVTPETVQSVIETMVRPASYYRTVSMTYVSGDSSYLETANVWVDSGWTRVDIMVKDRYVQHNIIGDASDGCLYRWYDQDSTYSTFSSGSAENDIAQRIPTYEDVIKLDRDSITGADYVQKDDYTCIYVEALNPVSGYQEFYWISLGNGVNGLLIAAELWKDGVMVYQMSSVGTIGTPAGSDADFTLPDGRVLHSVG